MIVVSTDPNLEVYDVDANGTSMYSYNGTPFTGTIRYYYDFVGSTTQIEYDASYVNGVKWGLQEEYHENGQKSEEWTEGKGGFNGQWKRWDEQGNLIYNKLWIDGVEQ